MTLIFFFCNKFYELLSELYDVRPRQHDTI